MSIGARLPSNIAVPVNIKTMPRYIGFRVNLNGPEVTSAVDVSNGISGVSCRLNAPAPLNMTNRPASNGTIPAQCAGPVSNCTTGK